MEKIDFVIIWVDGNDPEWQAEKRKYQPKQNEDVSVVRYRDWDTLRYWFRAVEQFAPWVNKVHLVTCGHLPKWLNTAAPKLNIVFHSDYIPPEYLPTFSSHTIELNLHRIKELSEHFVYFNDDTFLNASVKPKDFFRNGKAVRQFILTAALPGDNTICRITYNDVRAINRHFNMRQFFKKHWGLILYPFHGRLGVKNIIMLPYAVFPGFQTDHLPTPYTKKLFQQVWAEEEQILRKTCSHKFRSEEDVNQWLFLYWDLASGNFVPCGKRGGYCEIGSDNSKLFQIMRSKRIKMFCCNDSDNIDDFEQRKQELIAVFEEKYPMKSSFEI